MTKTTLVTGGTGYLGSAVVRELLRRGDCDCLYTYPGEPLAAAPERGLRFDLTRTNEYRAAAERLASVDRLVHTAAIVAHGPVGNLADDLQTQVIANFEILRNLIEWLPNLKKIVYISSCSAEIAEQDPSFYGLGKRFIEQSVEHLSRHSAIQQVTLRFPQLYGPHEPHGTFITKFIEGVRRNQELTLVNDGAVVRDVLYETDAVGSIMQALDGSKQGSFTIADPKAHTVKEVLDAIIALANPNYNALATKYVPEQEVAAASFHFTSTAAALGYELQYSLTEGLQETIKQLEAPHVSQ